MTKLWGGSYYKAGSSGYSDEIIIIGTIGPVKIGHGADGKVRLAVLVLHL
jgi:hypothetical protein